MNGTKGGGDSIESRARKYYSEAGYKGEELEFQVNDAVARAEKRRADAAAKEATKNTTDTNKVPATGTVAPKEPKAGELTPPKDFNLEKRTEFYTKQLTEQGKKGKELERGLNWAINRDLQEYNLQVTAYNRALESKTAEAKRIFEEQDTWYNAVGASLKSVWNDFVLPSVSQIGNIPAVINNLAEGSAEVLMTASNIYSGKSKKPFFEELAEVSKKYDESKPQVQKDIEQTLINVGEGFDKWFDGLAENVKFDVPEQFMGPIIVPNKEKGYTEDTYSPFKLESWEVDNWKRWSGSIGQGLASTASIMTVAGLTGLLTKSSKAAKASAMVTGALMETDGILRELQETHGFNRNEAMAIASVAGPLIGSIDALFGIENIAGKGFFRGLVSKEIKEELARHAGKKLTAETFQLIGKNIATKVRHRAINVATKAGLQSGVEGLTEGVQKGMELSLMQLFDTYAGFESKTGKKLFDSAVMENGSTSFELNAKSMMEIVNESILGFITSTPFGLMHAAGSKGGDKESLYAYIENEVKKGNDPRATITDIINQAPNLYSGNQAANIMGNVNAMIDVAEQMKGVKGTSTARFQLYTLAQEKSELQREAQTRQQARQGILSEIEALENEIANPTDDGTTADANTRIAALTAQLQQFDNETHFDEYYADSQSLIDRTSAQIAKTGQEQTEYAKQRAVLQKRFNAKKGVAPAAPNTETAAPPVTGSGVKTPKFVKRPSGSEIKDMAIERGGKSYIKDANGDWFETGRTAKANKWTVTFNHVTDSNAIAELEQLQAEKMGAKEPIVTSPPVSTDEAPITPVTPEETPVEPLTTRKYNTVDDVKVAVSDEVSLEWENEEGDLQGTKFTVQAITPMGVILADTSTGESFIVPEKQLKSDLFQIDEEGSLNGSPNYKPMINPNAKAKETVVKEEAKPKEETPAPKEETKKPPTEKPKENTDKSSSVEQAKNEQKKSDPVSTQFVTARSKDGKSFHYFNLVKHADGTYSIADKEQKIKGSGFKSMQEVEQYFATVFDADGYVIQETQDLIPLEERASLDPTGLSFLDYIKQYRDYISKKYLGYVHDIVNDTYYKIYEQDTTKSRKEYKSDQYKSVKVNGKIYLRKTDSYNVSADTGNGVLKIFNENKERFDIINSETANRVFDLLDRVGIETLSNQSEEFKSFKHDVYGLDNLYSFIESIEKKQYKGGKNKQVIDNLYELNKEETKAPAAGKTKLIAYGRWPSSNGIFDKFTIDPLENGATPFSIFEIHEKSDGTYTLKPLKDLHSTAMSSSDTFKEMMDFKEGMDKVHLGSTGFEMIDGGVLEKREKGKFEIVRKPKARFIHDKKETSTPKAEETKSKAEPKTKPDGTPLVGGYNNAFQEAIESGEALVGTKKRTMTLADGTVIEYVPVVVDAPLVLPSHDPTKDVKQTKKDGTTSVGFEVTEGYPTVKKKGLDSVERTEAANSRQYDKKSVIDTVLDNAYNLIAKLMIGGNNAADGDSIVTKDGVVISGNSRIMSLWLAIKNNASKSTHKLQNGKVVPMGGNYDKYLAELRDEIADSPGKYAGITVEAIDKMVAEGKHPVLVKYTESVKEYSKAEFDRYNQDLTQGKPEAEKAEVTREAASAIAPEMLQALGVEMTEVNADRVPVDMAVTLKKKKNAKAVLDILLAAKLIAQQKLTDLINNGLFTDAGITKVKELLRAIIIPKELIEIFTSTAATEEFGVKQFVRNIERALPALLYNFSIPMESGFNLRPFFDIAAKLKLLHVQYAADRGGTYTGLGRKGVEGKNDIEGLIDYIIYSQASFPTEDIYGEVAEFLKNDHNRMFVSAIFAAGNASGGLVAATDLVRLFHAFNEEYRKAAGEQAIDATDNLFAGEVISRQEALTTVETLIATYYPSLLRSVAKDPKLSQADAAAKKQEAEDYNKNLIIDLYEKFVKQGVSQSTLEKFARDYFGGTLNSGQLEQDGAATEEKKQGTENESGKDTDTGRTDDKSDVGGGESTEAKPKATEAKTDDSEGREPKDSNADRTDEGKGKGSATEKRKTKNQEKIAEIAAENDDILAEFLDIFGAENPDNPTQLSLLPGTNLTPEQEAKVIKLAIKLVGNYVKMGYYKLSEMMADIIERYKPDFAKTIAPHIKNAYSSYRDNEAVDEDADEMDGRKELRAFNIDDLIAQVQKDKAKREETIDAQLTPRDYSVGKKILDEHDRSENKLQTDILSVYDNARKAVQKELENVDGVLSDLDNGVITAFEFLDNIIELVPTSKLDSRIIDKIEEVSGVKKELFTKNHTYLLQYETENQQKTRSDNQRLRDGRESQPRGTTRRDRAIGAHPERPEIIYASKDKIPAPEEKIGEDEYVWLDEHQRFAANMALTAFDKGKKGFMLADGPGVGKTGAIITVAAEVAKKKGKGKVLIVTKSKEIIEDSFKRDAKSLGIDYEALGIKIITYHELSKKDSKGVFEYSKNKYELVVFDEAHLLKNAGAERSTAAHNLTVNHMLFATATPMDKTDGIIYFASQLMDVSEEAIYNELGFNVQNYTDEKGNRKRRAVLQKGQKGTDQIKRVEALATKLVEQGVILRREYPFWGSIEEVVIMPSNMAEYTREELAIAEATGGGRNMISELRRWNEPKKVAAIWEIVKQELAAGRKVVVMANFINETEIGSIGKSVVGFITQFEERAKAAGIPYASIYGNYNKAAEQNKFNDGEVDLVLATIESGGTGINLDDRFGDEPRTLIVASAPFAGDAFQQVIGRVSRKMSQSPAKAILTYIAGVSDAHLQGVLAKKLRTLKAIQEGKLEVAEIDENELFSESMDADGNIVADFTEAGERRMEEAAKRKGKTAKIETKEIGGDRVAIVGDTFRVKERIKALGGKWNGDMKAWVFPLSKLGEIQSEFKEELSSDAKFSITPTEVAPNIPGITPQAIEQYQAWKAAQDAAAAKQAAKTPGQKQIDNNKRRSKIIRLAAAIQKLFPQIKIKLVTAEEFYEQFKDKIDKSGKKATDYRGSAVGDTVWINLDAMTATDATVVHEFAHIWNSIAKQYFNKIYMDGLALVKGTEYEVRVRATRPDLAGDPEAILEEALVMAIEDAGAAILARGVFAKFATWLRNLYIRIGRKFGLLNPLSMAELSLEQFSDLIASRILSGEAVNIDELVSDGVGSSMDILGLPLEAATTVATAQKGLLGSKFSFIGVSGMLSKKTKGLIADMFKTALAMEASGMTNEQIRLATGWFKNPYDKKWRYEVSDQAVEYLKDGPMKLMWATDAKPVKLKDIIKHDKLFEEYPELAEIEVSADVNDGELMAQHLDGKIKVGMHFFTATTEQQLSALMHETQHAIQHKEGFAKGGNPSAMLEILDYQNDRVAESMKRLESFTTIPQSFMGIAQYYNMLKKAEKDPALLQALMATREGFVAGSEAKTLKKMIAETEAVLDDFDTSLVVDYRGRSIRDYVGKTDAFYQKEAKVAATMMTKYSHAFRDYQGRLERFDALIDMAPSKPGLLVTEYYRLAGEIEARNVQRRMRFTDKERVAEKPLSKDDVYDNYLTDNRVNTYILDEDADRALYAELLGFSEPTDEEMAKFSINDIPLKKDTKGNLLAPNGKPTNLTERQWLQVRTPEFKAWFGDWESDPKNASKVVDANGEPMVVYHGTNESFYEFNGKRDSSGLGGTYFTPKKDRTAIYGKNAMSVFLNLRNPLDISKKSMFFPFKEQIEADKKNGNDGYINIRPHEQEYIAFEPNQIKSATDNTGTFSPDTSDIRFSINNNDPIIASELAAYQAIERPVSFEPRFSISIGDIVGSTPRFSVPTGYDLSEFLGQNEIVGYASRLSAMPIAGIVTRLQTDLDPFFQSAITNRLYKGNPLAAITMFNDIDVLTEVAERLINPFAAIRPEAQFIFNQIFDLADRDKNTIFGRVNKYRLEKNYRYNGQYEKINSAADVADVLDRQAVLEANKTIIKRLPARLRRWSQQNLIKLFNFTTISKWYSSASGTLAKFEALVRLRNQKVAPLATRNQIEVERLSNKFSKLTTWRGVNNYDGAKKISVTNERDGERYDMPVDFVISMVMMQESMVDYWARKGKTIKSPLIDDPTKVTPDDNGFIFKDFDDPTITRVIRVSQDEYDRIKDLVQNDPRYSQFYNELQDAFNRPEIYDALASEYAEATGHKLEHVPLYFPLKAVLDADANYDLMDITLMLEDMSILRGRKAVAKRYELTGALTALQRHYEQTETFIQNQEVVHNLKNYLTNNKSALELDTTNGRTSGMKELTDWLGRYMEDLNAWRKLVRDQNADMERTIGNYPKIISLFALSRFAWNFGMPLIQTLGYLPAFGQRIIKDRYLLMGVKDVGYYTIRAYTDSLLLAGDKDKLPIIPVSTGEAALMDEIRDNQFAGELFIRLHHTNPDVDLTSLEAIDPRSSKSALAAVRQGWNWFIHTVSDKYGMSLMRRGDRGNILALYKAASYQFNAENVGGQLDGMNKDEWVATKAIELMYATNQMYPVNQKTDIQRNKHVITKMIALFSGQQQKQVNLAFQNYADYTAIPSAEGLRKLGSSVVMGLIASALGTAIIHTMAKAVRDMVYKPDDDEDEEKKTANLIDYFRTDFIRGLTGNLPFFKVQFVNTAITAIDQQYWIDKPIDMPPIDAAFDMAQSLAIGGFDAFFGEAAYTSKEEYAKQVKIHKAMLSINRNASQLVGFPYEFARMIEAFILNPAAPEKPAKPLPTKFK